MVCVFVIGLQAYVLAIYGIILLSFVIVIGLQVSVVGLERALHHYTLEPTEQPFDMKSVPLETQPMTEQKAGKRKGGNSYKC